jgi:hypothetical protein
VLVVTELLQRAFEMASRLPAPEQDALAARMIEEIRQAFHVDPGCLSGAFLFRRDERLRPRAGPGFATDRRVRVGWTFSDDGGE